MPATPAKDLRTSLNTNGRACLIVPLHFLSRKDQNLWTRNNYSTVLLWTSDNRHGRSSSSSPWKNQVHSCQTSEGILKDAVAGVDPCISGGTSANGLWRFLSFFMGVVQVKLSVSGARGHVDNALKALSTVQIKSTQIPQGWRWWHMDIRTGVNRHVPFSLSLALFLYLPFFPSTLQLKIHSHVHFEDKTMTALCEKQTFESLPIIFCSQMMLNTKNDFLMYRDNISFKICTQVEDLNNFNLLRCIAQVRWTTFTVYYKPLFKSLRIDFCIFLNKLIFIFSKDALNE